jgi:hypothetical protein
MFIVQYLLIWLEINKYLIFIIQLSAQPDPKHLWIKIPQLIQFPGQI